MALFITFEGVDGVGKTTQANMLLDFFIKKNVKARLIREPGSTPLGERIREILLAGSQDSSPLAEFLLFSAARAQITESIIIPALKAGEFVIADRYFDSSTAYQSFASGLNLSDVEAVNRVASLGLIPDVTFLLDGPDLAADGKKAPDNFEKKGLSFQNAAREGFAAIAKNHGRFAVINFDKSAAPHSIHGRVLKILSGRYQNEACFGDYS